VLSLVNLVLLVWFHRRARDDEKIDDFAKRCAPATAPCSFLTRRPFGSISANGASRVQREASNRLSLMSGPTGRQNVAAGSTLQTPSGPCDGLVAQVGTGLGLPV
jgi:hypothetical protein